MALYRLECEGECREVYVVEAPSEAEARELFEQGEAGQPEISEVTGSEVVRAEEVEPV